MVLPDRCTARKQDEDEEVTEEKMIQVLMNETNCSAMEARTALDEAGEQNRTEQIRTNQNRTEQIRT